MLGRDFLYFGDEGCFGLGKHLRGVGVLLGLQEQLADLGHDLNPEFNFVLHIAPGGANLFLQGLLLLLELLAVFLPGDLFCLEGVHHGLHLRPLIGHLVLKLHHDLVLDLNLYLALKLRLLDQRSVVRVRDVLDQDDEHPPDIRLKLYLDRILLNPVLVFDEVDEARGVDVQSSVHCQDLVLGEAI